MLGERQGMPAPAMLPIPYPPVPEVHKIAVLRANALGDFIVTLPALEALRAAYPGAEIVLLAKPWHAALLDGRPGPVDRVVVVPPTHGVGIGPGEREDPAALDAFFEAMAGERFDLALQLYGGGGSSNPFVLRLGARLTAGQKTPDAAPLDRWIPYVFYQHEILRFLEIVALVGAAPVTLEPRLAVTDADREEAARIVHDDGRPLVALHPGAGDPRRRWPPERFAMVGDALAAAGAHVVVTGTDGERAIVAATVAAMNHEAADLCARLSLGGLAGLLARCRVAVSNDSGPRHLAAAVGAPTVGIFWSGNVINAGPLTRTRHRPLLSWRMDCPTCGRHCVYEGCDHSPSFVADVTADEVIAEALDLFAHFPEA